MTKLLPFIKHQCNHPIWRMEIDGTSGNIFLEVRNGADKMVSFSSVNLQTGRLNFDGLETPERWLTGIEAAYAGVLLIHNYQSESGPVHKGIVAIDGASSNTLWSNYTLAFDHLSVNGPVVYSTQIQPKRLSLADVRTGNILRSYQPVIDTEPDNHITSPQLIPASSLITFNFTAQPYENTAHYIEHNNFRIVSLHTFLDQQLQQHLYIFDDKGHIVYQDLLQSNIQKLQPEAFVVHKYQLIYLKNRSELIVLNLLNTVL